MVRMVRMVRNGSNGSVPRRSNLSTLVRAAGGVLGGVPGGGRDDQRDRRKDEEGLDDPRRVAVDGVLFHRDEAAREHEHSRCWRRSEERVRLCLV